MGKRTIVFLFLACVFAGARAQDDDNAMAIVQMKFADPNACTDLNPYKAPVSRAANNRVYAIIFEPLVRYDFMLNQPVGVLAKSWEVASDNLKLTLHLRDDVYWHHINQKFSATDVEFTFQYIRNMAQSENFRRRYDFINRIVVVDSFTVTIHFSQPQPNGLISLDAWMLPKCRFSSNFIELEDRAAKLLPFSERPIGTGPFKLVQQGVDRNINFVVHSRYWGQRSQIHQIKDSYIADDESRVGGLLFGGQDLLTEASSSHIPRIESTPGFRMDPYQSYSFDAIALNNTNTLLRDPVLRKAITLGTDRKQILDEWYASQGSLIHGPVVMYAPYYNNDLAPLPYDPETARSLLQDAGYVDTNGDGIREKNGQPLRFTLLAPGESAAQSTEIQNVALSFVNYQKEIGIQILQQNVVHDEYYRRLYQERSFDMTWVRFIFGTSYDISALFHSRNNYRGGYNIVSYNNPEVDRLLDEFARSSDRLAKMSIMQHIQEVLREDCPYTFLYTVNNFAAYSRDLVNVRIDPFYFFTFVNQWIKH